MVIQNFHLELSDLLFVDYGQINNLISRILRLRIFFRGFSGRKKNIFALKRQPLRGGGTKLPGVFASPAIKQAQPLFS